MATKFYGVFGDIYSRGGMYNQREKYNQLVFRRHFTV